MSWGPDWGDEPRKRRFGSAKADREISDPEREEQIARERNEHYWARPRDVGSDRYAAQVPSRIRGQSVIEEATDRAARRLGPAVSLLICPPCGAGHHENCLTSFHLNDGGELVMCECSADAHWIHRGGR